MFQKILVSVLVALSSIYLIRMIWRKFFKKNTNCETCAMGKTQTPQNS